MLTADDLRVVLDDALEGSLDTVSPEDKSIRIDKKKRFNP